MHFIMEPTTTTSDPGDTNLPVTTTDTPVMATTTTAEGAVVPSVRPPATDALTPSAGTDVAVTSEPQAPYGLGTTTVSNDPLPTVEDVSTTPTPGPLFGDPAGPDDLMDQNTGNGAATATPPTPSPAPTSPAPEAMSDADTEALIELYLSKHPDYVPVLLGKLDDTPGDEREQDIEGFIVTYTSEHPGFAAKLQAQLVTPLPVLTSPEGSTPVDTTPATPTPEPTTTLPVEEMPEPTATLPVPVTPPAPEPTPPKQPVPFPDTLYFSKGDSCTVDLGGQKVDGTITGIYTDSEGLFFQVERHISDGVPMRGTAARTIKIDVPADLVS